MVEQGQLTLGVLESCLETERDWAVRQAIVNALGPVYLKMAEQGQKVSLEAFESRLKTEEDWRVRQAIVDALIPVYVKMVETGQLTLEALESRLKTEKDWRLKHAFIDALSLGYLKKAEQGQLTLDALENRRKTEKDPDVRQAIANALVPLALKMTEQGQKVDNQDVYAFLNMFRLSSGEVNTWVLDRTLAMSMDDLLRYEELLTEALGAFRESNAKLEKGRQLSEESFQNEYLPLIYFLEILLPDKGAQYVISGLRNNRGPGGVMRFWMA